MSFCADGESVHAAYSAPVLASLDEREQKIMRLYFGLDGEEALTLEQIGVLMNLTRPRAHPPAQGARPAQAAPSPRYEALIG